MQDRHLCWLHYVFLGPAGLHFLILELPLITSKNYMIEHLLLYCCTILSKQAANSTEYYRSRQWCRVYV